jgi:hypothetical protein
MAEAGLFSPELKSSEVNGTADKITRQITSRNKSWHWDKPMPFRIYVSCFFCVPRTLNPVFMLSNLLEKCERHSLRIEFITSEQEPAIQSKKGRFVVGFNSVSGQ